MDEALEIRFIEVVESCADHRVVVVYALRFLGGIA